MQTFIDYGSTIMSGILTILRLRAALKARKTRSEAERFATTWLHLLCLTFFLFFQIDDVYIAIGDLTGINNLSWLFSYLFLAPAIYFISRSFAKKSRWILPWLTTGMLSLVIIFPFGPGSAPEILDHITPQNEMEILYMAVMYTLASVMIVAIPLSRSARALRIEEQHIRTRTIVTILASVATITMYVTKFTAFSSSFYFPSLSNSVVHAITDAARVSEIAVVVLWFPAFLSNRIYVAVERVLAVPVELLRKIETWFYLNKLTSRLQRHCPSLTLLPTTTWEQLSNLDFYTYRKLIEAMDGQRVLADNVIEPGQETKKANAPFDSLELAFIQNSTPDIHHWNSQDTEEALYLHQKLDSIPKSLTTFERLAQAYCDVEKQMRRYRVTRNDHTTV